MMENVLSKPVMRPGQRFFDDFLTKDLFNFGWGAKNVSYVPMVNIMETAEDFRIDFAVPGMNKNDFKIEMESQVLTISSDVPGGQNGNEEFSYVRREFNYQSFRRSFQLPETVEFEKIEAKYRNGMLSIFIPKKDEAKRKPVKAISIS
ncbi:Hsp20/alpha crystallin family protein [Negadavirga shengliensis]|uniref:Hsp20/alpha crystallin family protein n=1 Tax=Negadavirga shengliensis TaxID=1389218 RepID=A0ABV9SZX7_9BACT